MICPIGYLVRAATYDLPGNFRPCKGYDPTNGLQYHDLALIYVAIYSLTKRKSELVYLWWKYIHCGATHRNKDNVTEKDAFHLGIAICIQLFRYRDPFCTFKTVYLIRTSGVAWFYPKWYRYFTFYENGMLLQSLTPLHEL